MNIEKSNLKIFISNDLGASLEDRMEGEQKAANELNGAAHALRQAAKKVPTDLAAKIDQSLEAGEIPETMDAPLVAQFAKKYLTKVGDFLLHLAEVEQQKAVAQAGRVDGLREAMKLIQKIRDDEAQKIKAFADVLHGEEDAVVNAGVNVRTPSELARASRGSLADRRQAEGSSPSVDPPVEENRSVEADAARVEHGSLADRRASETDPSRPKKRRGKGKLRAVKRDG